MDRRLLLAALALALLPHAPALAEDQFTALRPRVFASSDADGNETWKTSLGWDWTRTDREHWTGVDVEHARFSGDGWSHSEQRAYLNAGGTFGTGETTDDTWRWQARVGSNGDDLIGSASLHTEGPHRRELFVERDLLETRGGTELGRMSTFAGAAIDQPLGGRLSGTLLAGLQDFGDDNLRTHLRGNLVHALLPEQGISLQLRTRYYRNSEPYAGDYYSPEWYGEALGVLALRRVIGGYTWRAAAGIGRQRSADDDWKRARMVQVGLETPRWKQSWLRLDAGYSDTPVATSTGAGSYSYRYLMLEAVTAF
ncbi:hypothetical protein H0E84_15395 [Luteimonas sp. SJ-92]|uniref:Uncharacterized protein n=1 Tax=Luteimonas salinisoli TaxID=2752307 RepID=A0A853JEK6_9GAMM|nr:hypothetical protein [Luteimonas salinisoli]NZA27763.1 hypothetical protein [Luteimonas salinisoli]